MTTPNLGLTKPDLSHDIKSNTIPALADNFQKIDDGFGSLSKSTGTTAPTTGTWSVGDKVWNTSPAVGGYIGWVCTTAGSPGTWTPFGVIRNSKFGTATIASGTTSIVVNHGLSIAPTNVTATPQANVGAWWITNITSTQFTINCASAPGSAVTVSWRAEV